MPIALTWPLLWYPRCAQLIITEITWPLREDIEKQIIFLMLSIPHISLTNGRTNLWTVIERYLYISTMSKNLGKLFIFDHLRVYGRH